VNAIISGSASHGVIELLLLSLLLIVRCSLLTLLSCMMHGGPIKQQDPKFLSYTALQYH